MANIRDFLTEEFIRVNSLPSNFTYGKAIYERDGVAIIKQKTALLKHGRAVSMVQSKKALVAGDALHLVLKTKHYTGIVRVIRRIIRFSVNIASP